VFVTRSLCGTRVRVEHATGKVRPKPWLRRGGGGGPARAPSPRPVRRSYESDRERCAYCGERGHPSYDCPRERRGRRRCCQYSAVVAMSAMVYDTLILVGRLVSYVLFVAGLWIIPLHNRKIKSNFCSAKMSQVNRRFMMAETSENVHCIRCQTVLFLAASECTVELTPADR